MRGLATPRPPPARMQRGLVLFVALIALLVLSFGAIALVRAIDADSTLAGNLAFREASTAAGDIGVSLGVATLNGLSNREQDQLASGYYASVASLSVAVPAVTRWSGRVCFDAADPGTTIDCADSGRYRLQVLVERLCTSAPALEPLSQCVADDAADDGSKKAGAVTIASKLRVHYRVSARVRGPRNAEALVQSLVAQ